MGAEEIRSEERILKIIITNLPALFYDFSRFAWSSPAALYLADCQFGLIDISLLLLNFICYVLYFNVVYLLVFITYLGIILFNFFYFRHWFILVVVSWCPFCKWSLFRPHFGVNRMGSKQQMNKKNVVKQTEYILISCVPDKICF